MKWLILAAAAAFTVYLVRQGQGGELQDDMPDQTAGTFESLIHQINPMQYLEDDVPQSQAARNERAILDMIAYAEGTSSPDGYQMMFGGGLFASFADHPRVLHAFTNKVGQQLKTSAAGRYQFLARTWDELRDKLDLPDFGPASQDAAALELIRQRGALPDVHAGRLTAAIAKIAPIWASLPGAGYNQPERKLASLIAAFQSNGGTLEA